MKKKKLLIPFLLLLLTFTVLEAANVSAASDTEAANASAASDTEVTAATEAKIGSKKYTSLDEAMKAVKNGQTIKLMTDVSYKKNDLTVDRSKVKFTLNLNGHTLKFSSGHGLIVKNGSMTVTGKKGTLRFGTSGSTVKSGGTLTLKSGTYRGTIENKGTMKITGGTFSKTFLSNGKTMTISGGTFNSIALNNSGTAKISGGTFSKPGIINGKTMTISGGTFKNYQNGKYQGMISNWGEGSKSVKLTVSGGTFKMSQQGTIFVNYYGGILNLKKATATCTNTKGEVLLDYGYGKTTISGGKYTSKGDLMTVVSGSSAKIKGGTFKLTGGSSTIIMKTCDNGKITVSGGTFIAPKSYAYCVKAKAGVPDGTVTINGGNFSSVKTRKKSSATSMPYYF